jgi:hypothetical protein
MVGKFIQLRKIMLPTKLDKISLQPYFYFSCVFLFFGYLIWLYFFSLPFNQDIISHWNAKLDSNTYLSQQQFTRGNFLTAPNYFYSILNALEVSVFKIRIIQFILVFILCLILAKITTSVSCNLSGSFVFFILFFGSMRYFQYCAFFPELVLYEVLISMGILLLFLFDFTSLSQRNQKVILFLLGSILGTIFFIFSNSLLILVLFLVFVYRKKLALRREFLLNSIVICLPIIGLILFRFFLDKTPLNLSYLSSFFYFKAAHFIGVCFLIFEVFVKNISLIGFLIPFMLFLLCINILKNKREITSQRKYSYSELIIFLIVLCVILIFERSYIKELLVAPLPFVYTLLTLGIVYNLNGNIKKEFSFFIFSVLTIWTLYSLNSVILMKADFEKKVKFSDLIKLTSHFKKQLPINVNLCAPIKFFDSVPNKNLCEKFIDYKHGKMTFHLEVIHGALFPPPDNTLPMFILTPQIFELIQKSNSGVYIEFKRILDDNFLSFMFKSIIFYLPKNKSKLYKRLSRFSDRFDRF